MLRTQDNSTAAPSMQPSVITVRNSSCGRVMFSQVFVYPGVGEVYSPGQTHRQTPSPSSPGQTHGQTPPGQTPTPGQTSPPGQTPPARQTPPEMATAVRILVECILVTYISITHLIPGRLYWHIVLPCGLLIFEETHRHLVPSVFVASYPSLWLTDIWRNSKTSG